MIPTLPRDQLANALGGNMRLVRAFEDQNRAVVEVVEQASLNVAATDALDEATVLTLSANAAFRNERVLTPGVGIDLVDEAGKLTVKIDASVPQVAGDGLVKFYATGPVNLMLPASGTLATTADVIAGQSATRTLSLSIVDLPQADPTEPLYRFRVPQDWTFVTSTADAGVAATGTPALRILNAGTQVGSILFAGATGTVTFSAAGFLAGTLFEIYPPITTDGTLDRVSISLNLTLG